MLDIVGRVAFEQPLGLSSTFGSRLFVIVVSYKPALALPEPMSCIALSLTFPRVKSYMCTKDANFARQCHLENFSKDVQLHYMPLTKNV